MELERLEFGEKEKLVISLPGGGIAAAGIGKDPEVSVEGPIMAVLSGTISNYSYLLHKYVTNEIDKPLNTNIESIRSKHIITN